jgi:hypothetical protein
VTQSLSFLLLSCLLLANCSTPPALAHLRAPGGVKVVSPDMAVTLPDGWRELETPPAKTLLAADDAGGTLHLVIAGPLGAADGTSKDALVTNASYQKGVQRALLEGQFAKIERAGMTEVAGMNAYRCEATSRDGSQSILQVHVPQRERLWVLTFYSSRQRVSKSAAVEKILGSFQLAPRG